MNTGYRGRFAPSPTGDLHAGSLLAALGSWLLARHADGAWLIRVEDIDPPREVADAARRQVQTLQRFALLSDEPVLFQSSRDAAYRQALQQLLDAGHAFACHCSRTDLAATGGIHRQCVAGARRRTPAIRLRIPEGLRIGFDDALQGRVEQDLAAAVGDVVLRRADGCWAYQLAVVVDDAAQGITHVVRGADLLESTPRQIALQHALGLPTPQYLHLPLLVDADGRKLSKSADDAPVDGPDPMQTLLQAWQQLGQDAEAVADAGSVDAWLGAARAAFDPSRLPRSGVVHCTAAHNTPPAACP